MDFLTKETVDNLDLIRKILADSGFAEIKNITRLQSGSRSVAYYADDYIVRFPKAEIIWQTMQREKMIIDTVYPHLMPYFEDKIHKIEKLTNESEFNREVELSGDKKYGIITSSSAYNYAHDVCKFNDLDINILKLGFSYPFPHDLVAEFLKDLD